MDGSRADVRSVAALEDLRSAADRFGHNAIEALRAAEQELRVTEEWLQERVAHWRREELRWQTEVAAAEKALSHCRDCSGEKRALEEARHRLQQTTQQLANARTWQRIVNQEATAYRDQVVQMGRTLSSTLPMGTAFLKDKIADLKAYLAASPQGTSS